MNTTTNDGKTVPYIVRVESGTINRLAAIFSTGVCDFSKPGVEQVPLKGTYRRY